MAPAMKGRQEAPAAGRLHATFSKPAANIGRGESQPRRDGYQGACRLCLTRLFPDETDMPPATTIAGDSGARAAGVTVLLATGRTGTKAGRGGKAACVALRAGARLSSATRTRIGGPDGGQLAAPAAPEVRCGSVAPAPNREQTRASKSAATCCSGQSLLPVGEAKLTPAARGREGLGPVPSAGSKLTRSSRASRGVARLSRMEVTGARGIQAAPTSRPVGAARRQRPTHPGR